MVDEKFLFLNCFLRMETIAYQILENNKHFNLYK